MSFPSPTINPSAPPPTSDPALVFDDVSKSYPQGTAPVWALQNVSISLQRGSSTSIMGPSGSGKSTFLNCAAGLDAPSSGRVHVGDTELSGLSSDHLTRFRRDRIGFVFQAYNLVPQLSVIENINLPLLLAGRDADAAWRTELINAVGLDGLEDRLPGQLSGGQAQRVAIARALLTRPEVLFADEPTGAVDSTTGAQILALLDNASRQLGQTVVMVTHDPAVAAISDRVLFLVDGHIVGDVGRSTAAEIAAHMARIGGR